MSKKSTGIDLDLFFVTQGSLCKQEPCYRLQLQEDNAHRELLFELEPNEHNYHQRCLTCTREQILSICIHHHSCLYLFTPFLTLCHCVSEVTGPEVRAGKSHSRGGSVELLPLAAVRCAPRFTRPCVWPAPEYPCLSLLLSTRSEASCPLLAQHRSKVSPGLKWDHYWSRTGVCFMVPSVPSLAGRLVPPCVVLSPWALVVPCQGCGCGGSTPKSPLAA